MSESIYIVKRGDSLTKIARTHDTQAKTLAELNGINNPDVIRVGQRLRLPARNSVVPRNTNMSVPSSGSNVLTGKFDQDLSNEPHGWSKEGADGASNVLLQFFDVLSKPIEGLKVIIATGGQALSYLTDKDGQIPEIKTSSASPEVKVEVEKVTGGTKEVAKFNAALGWQHVLLTTPKLRLNSDQRPHEGPPPPVKIKSSATAPTSPDTATTAQAQQQLGKVTQARSPAGHPVTQVTLECPNPENLRLDLNFKYRDIIIAAGKRSGFMPQAIAAIMNAEAATITEVTYQPILDKDKKPVIDSKTGKPKTRKITKNYGEWNTKSASPASSARGMTQFLDGSWIDNALTSGTRLNDKVKKKGWLTTSTVRDKKGNEKQVPAFKLADGKLVTAAKGRPLVRVLSSRPYITGRATASDANVQALLDMRFDAECAIDAAVDYGTINLKGLKDAGYDLSKLNDGERAKIVYLCHHLGLADAKGFIQKTIGEDRAKTLLVTQVGNSSAEKYAKDAGGTYVEGHRAWLNTFENNRIILTKFMCDPSKAPTVRELTIITDSIKK